MKYIVCNSETAVFNRVYDELEKFIEDGAVFSFSDRVLKTQFAKRMVDEKNIGKYKYNNIIFIGQKEFADIDLEETKGLMHIMKRSLYKELDVDYNNIFYPMYLGEDDIQKTESMLKNNLIDVALLFVDSRGNILGYKNITDDNRRVHKHTINGEEAVKLAEKYSFELPSPNFINIGFDNLMKSRNIFLVILGEDKKQYVENIFEDECVDNISVLTYLKKHKNITIFVDKNAGYKSEAEVNKIIRDRKRREELAELRRLEKENLLANENSGDKSNE